MNQIKYFLIAVAVFMYSGCASVEKAGGVSQYVKQWDEKIERSRKGQYYDESTGLMWYVCSVGTGWRANSSDNGDTIGGCDSDSGYLRLNEEDTEKYIAEFINGKNFGGYSDWRLPTVFELEQIALANCRSWRREKTGDVLTEAGRKPTYATATRTTLDNQGRLIMVDDCRSYNYDVFDRAFGEDYRYILPYGQFSTFRVRESAVSRKYQAMISYDSVSLTSLKFNFKNYESGLSSEELARFYIVRQHTPAKGVVNE